MLKKYLTEKSARHSFVALCALYVVYVLVLQWHWGLMDDLSYIRLRNSEPFSIGTFAKILSGYVENGRYYFLGIIYKYLKYFVLPASVFAHRLFMLVFVGGLFYVFDRWFVRKYIVSNLARYFTYVVWMSAFCFRDMLDLYSIVEPFGLFFAFFAIHKIQENTGIRTLLLAMLACVLAVFCKEPYFVILFVIASILALIKNEKIKALAPFALMIVIALTLSTLKKGYSAGYGSKIDLNTILTIPLATLRNYNFTLLMVLAALVQLKFRLSKMAYIWLLTFLAYSGIITLWGSTDTFNYLYIPAVPFLALFFGSIIDSSKQDWVRVLAPVCMLLLVAQTVRGGIRSWSFNHEYEEVVKVMSTFKPLPEAAPDAGLWTNCEEAGLTLVAYGEEILKLPMYQQKGKKIYMLQFDQEKFKIKKGDWIVHSKRCDPFDLNTIANKPVYQGVFYTVVEVL